jgi:hypothetical protein
MADETRHAAWQSERSFAVRLLPEEGEPTELVDGIGEFLEAVEFAVEWLGREDPDRTGTASLAIYETTRGEAEKVWAYPPDDVVEGEPLLKIFGFDPVTWKPGSEGYVPREPALGTFFTRPPEGAPPPLPAPQYVPPPPAPRREPAPVFVAPEPEEPPPARPHVRPRRALSAAWADPVARSLLFLAGFTFWLAIAFGDSGGLLFVLVALSGLWWRRDKLVGLAETEADDWL